MVPLLPHSVASVLFGRQEDTRVAVTALIGQTAPCNSRVARVKELLSPATHPSLALMLLTLGSNASTELLHSCGIRLQRLIESQSYR